MNKSIKNIFKIFAIGFSIILLQSCTLNSIKNNEEEKKMTVTSTGIVNGVIEDKYGKRGTQFTQNGMPNYSLPLKIENAPEGTKTFAIFLEDKDAIPVAGFSWIHWVVANVKTNNIPENASLLQKDEFVQGRNSWSSSLLGNDALSVEESSMYGGMAPPNAEHKYEIHVYALSDELNLKNGFYANELFEQMEGKVLDFTTITGTYKN